MDRELIKIIAKIGKETSLRLINSKVYKAIMPHELKFIHESNPDANLLIVERIEGEEQDSMKEFITSFMSIDGNHVIFFVPDKEDEITAGIADELELDIYLTLSSLYEAIYKLTKVNVSIYLDDKKKYNTAIDIGGELANSFEDSLFADISDETKEDSVKQAESNEETKDKPQMITEEAYEIPVSELGNEDNAAEENKEIKVELGKKDEAEVEAEVKSSIPNDFDIENSELVNKLKIEIGDLKHDYAEALRAIKESTEYSKELKAMLDAVKEEKGELLEHLNSLLSDNDVIEEPISLSEYEKIKHELEEKIDKVKALEEALESTKSNLTATSKTLEQKNIEVYNILNQLNQEKSYRFNSHALLLKLSGELSSSLISNSIIESKLRNIESELASANESLDDFRSKNEDNIREIDAKNLEISSQENEIATLKKSLEEVESKVATSNKRAELADSFAESEKERYEAKINELKATLDMTREQLENKEIQYNNLLDKSKSAEATSEELVNTYNSLDTVNKTLKEKLTVMTSEMNELKRKNQRELAEKDASYQDRINKLTEALRIANTNSTNVATAISSNESIIINIPPINYNGAAQIIPVFGSGSVGITTMAMSLASQLGINNKVLYLDFDIVTPNADAWFSKSPMCKNIPMLQQTSPANARKMSALGVFLEYGVEMFERYAVNIIIQCERTKGGGIDYLSGLYYRPETSKVVSANYAEFLGYLGDMYNYIIVDMGRLGNSELNDSLIKAFCDIAFKVVTVTTLDRFELRNFKNKLSDTGIVLNKIAWLLNMCSNTVVDDKIKQIISPCEYGLMLKDATLQCIREKFTRNKLNKDRLDWFIQNRIFGR